VARAAAHVTYPARFQLIAAMNPCRCGYLSDAERACGKAPRCADDYQAKISGPLLDRFDMTIEVAEVPTLEMLGSEAGESSEKVASRVHAARLKQKERYQSYKLAIRTNAEISGDTLHQSVVPDSAGKALLEQATGQLKLSMRGYTRVLRVARTIADLEASETVAKHHIAEALSYRHLQLARLEAA
jgi:magnesium chelatase family protein